MFAMRMTAALLLLLLAACYPGGYSEQEWKSLSPQEQHEARMQQLAADEARANADAEQARMVTEIYRYDFEAQQQPLEDLKQPPQTGDVVIVTFLSGTVTVDGARVPFRPATYELWRGQSRRVTLRPDPGFNRPPLLFDIALDEGGTQLILDAGAEHPVALPRQRWEEGYLYRTSDAENRSLRPVDLTVFVRVKQF